MTRWALRIAVVALLAVGGVAAAFGATSNGSASTASVPVTGTTADGRAFTGTMTITGVADQNGQTVALGTISGTLAGVGAVSSVPFAAPVSGDPCTLLSFSLGPFDVSVLGIDVHIDAIGGNVTLSGLLGSLICPLLGGGTTT